MIQSFAEIPLWVRKKSLMKVYLYYTYVFSGLRTISSTEAK